MASAAVDLLIGKVGLILESGVPQLAGVGDELQHLMRELLAMKSFLEDTERSGALGEVEETWMEIVRDVSIDVQDIIDDFTLLGSYYFFDGTKVPQGICKLESLQVCDAIELEGMLVKQLRQLTQLTRMSITNVRESDEEDLCKSLESMKLIEHFFVHTSNEDEVLRLDALPSAPPSLKALGLIGKLEKLPLWFHSLFSLTQLRLHWSRLTEDFLPYIQALPNSSRLRLNNAYLGNQLVFHSGFPKLSELYIMELPKLNAIILHVFKV
ncbi:hypothetical protein C1H46_018848 [Malus baccata]|uniref:Uncharacterized protein n=1 Tax=Malus baccata TaxID=106549 RepID=A0A540M9Y2_MALBA|nr:hypothetical protein C1H46_018848 [Malus baccata]